VPFFPDTKLPHLTLTPRPCSPIPLPFMISLDNLPPASVLPLLPHLFSKRDIRRVARAMSTNKTTDEEGIQAEFLKQGIRSLESYIVDLFNQVVCSGFPLSWTRHIIHPIHKFGSSSDPNNYRTIMVGHKFSKLYATILHHWFSEEMERHHLRARGSIST
jgi:hypothetical protein